MINSEQKKELLRRYTAGLCTDEEKAAVESWYDGLAQHGHWEWTDEEKTLFGSLLKQRTMRQAFPRTRRFYFSRLAAAAAIIAVLTVSTYVGLHERKTKSTAQRLTYRNENEVKPGHEGAVLTIDGGKQIVLDSTLTGSLAMQGGIQIIKESGRIVYARTGVDDGKQMYNMMSTPNGRQYQMELSDGTKVWLNAESSIRYPVAFSGAERKVEVTGEVFFEVASAGNQPTGKVPFVVSIADGGHELGAIKVLGTQFNVNSYGDEGSVNTTLVEGKVLVRKEKNTALLKPGQQARMESDGRLNVVDDVNLDAETAWKDGFFSYDSTDVKTIMKQLARWYNIDVAYEDGAVPTKRFFGDIRRDAPLTSVLKVLHESGLDFTVDGRKITVLKN